jgi:hypothetical protein
MIRAALLFFAVLGSLLGSLGFNVFAQEQVGMKLEDSGFKMREANTPDRMAKLKSFPARKFVRRTRGGVPYFIYADPDYCKCAYVGTQAAMDTFRGMSARASGLPGYTGPVDTSKPSGANTEAEMITDMGDDGNMPGDENDIFHPGLFTIPLR